MRAKEGARGPTARWSGSGQRRRAVSVKAMRRAFVVFLLTVLALVAAALLLYRYAIRYPDRPLGAPGQAVSVQIPTGRQLPQGGAAPAGAGAAGQRPGLPDLHQLQGQAAKVRAGNYSLKPDITPRNLLDILVHGVPAPTVKVLIPEGKNMLEVARIIADAQIADYDALVREMRNPRFLRRIGVEAETLEGYLFPDTYKLKAFTPPQEVLEKLYRRHGGSTTRWWPSTAARLKRLRKKLRWGHHEIVIMASIVEKETGQKHERPLIAGVFLNRLTFGHFQPAAAADRPHHRLRLHRAAG